MTCFNLNRTFLYPNTTYNSNGYGCINGQPCGANYTLTNAIAFDANANYTDITYSQSQLGAGNDAKGALAFSTYPGQDCQQGGMDGQGAILPWIRWDCVGQAECKRIEYPVASFAVAPYRNEGSKEEGGEGECVVAAVYGHNSGAALRAGRVVWVAAGAILGAFLIFG